MAILKKIFGDANEKYLKKLQPTIDKINSLEPEFESFSDEKLKEKTLEFKARLSPKSEQARFKSGKGKTLEDILPEAFALVREASKRTLNQRHFDVQLIGGIVLHEGKIAEMITGEGKTLSATLPIYLNALNGKGVHLVTVNDYLARRDTVWMGQIYHFLGLSVGCLNHEQSFLYDPNYKKPDEEKDRIRDELGGFRVVEDFLRPCERKEAYLADITYGTNNEFGFDYLRDNMAYDLNQMVQVRGNTQKSGFGGTQNNPEGEPLAPYGASAENIHNFAIVDEVDSILIDEARTPLIISAPDIESSKWYEEFSRIIPKLDPKTDYEIDEKMRAVTLTEAGVNRVEKILGMGNIYEEKGIKYLHHLEQALRAQALFKKDKDYVVKDGQVIIVDEFTGRLMPGRRWSGGLHQAVEAKERVSVQAESLTLASITFQNYFRMYEKLAGMTGTAATSAEEFDKVYNLEVIVVPTNKPLIRKSLPDRVYKTEKSKFEAVVGEIKERHQKGQPVLVGTVSIEKNEYLGKLLQREGISHQILNAKNHEREGQIIAQAGKLRAVTVATNMAGRGVDIMLGGYPPSNVKTMPRTEIKFLVRGQNSPKESLRFPTGQAKVKTDEEFEKWKENHDKVVALGGLHVIGTERHEARRIDNQLRGRAGRQGDPGASQFFVSLEDDLLRIFGGERIISLMNTLNVPEDQPIEANLLSGVIESAQSKIEGINFDLRKRLLEYDDVSSKHREIFYKKRKELLQVSPQELKQRILEIIKKENLSIKDYEKKEAEIGSENMRQIERMLALRILSMLWMEHLEDMDYLRDSVKLRAYGNRDPLVEYKREAHKMFQELLETFETGIVQALLRISVKPPAPQYGSGSRTNLESNQRKSVVVSYNQQAKHKPGRNDPCPCGKKDPKTGKPIKYKKCCSPKYG